MSEGKEMIGMPVVTNDTGDEIARVKDVIVHRVKKCVVGFLVRRAGLFQHAKVVPFSEVSSFAKSAVMVPTASSIWSLEQVPDASRLLERKPFAGSMLISSEGHELGRICDFHFDDDTGEINGFEFATDVDEDTKSEPEFLPLDDDVFVGRDDVIVSGKAAERLMGLGTEEARTAEFDVVIPPTPPVKSPVPPQPQPQLPAPPAIKPAAPETNLLKHTIDGTSLTIGFNTTDIPDDLSIAGYREQILRLLAEHRDCTKLIFDVTDIKIIPSVMLGLLVNLRKQVDTIEILNPEPVVREVLKILGFDKYMTIRKG